MKNKSRLAALLLALVLAAGAAAASGESLVSLSYLRDIFAHTAGSAVDSRLDQADTALEAEARHDLDILSTAAGVLSGQSYAGEATEATLKQGDTLTAASGSTVAVLEGEVDLHVTGGALVDVTAGKAVPSGSVLTPGHRYITAEETLASFTVRSSAAVLSYEGRCAVAAADTTPDYYGMALALRQLGLFRGTGSPVGEGFALCALPSRAQGLVMFIRLLGEETQALACGYSHPFTDVPQWLDRYVAWGYHQGYTNGVSPTQFGSDSTISAKQYEEFLLRAMGYSVAGSDDYNTSLERAEELGVLTGGEYAMLTGQTFTRAHVVYLSYYGLDTSLSGGQTTLAQRLMEQNVFSSWDLEQARGIVNSSRLS